VFVNRKVDHYANRNVDHPAVDYLGCAPFRAQLQGRFSLLDELCNGSVLGRRVAVAASAPVHFLELDVRTVSSARELLLTLPADAVTIDMPPGFDPALLSQVVGILTTVC